MSKLGVFLSVNRAEITPVNTPRSIRPNELYVFASGLRDRSGNPPKVSETYIVSQVRKRRITQAESGCTSSLRSPGGYHVWQPR
jgi:hypothetical protein